MIWGFRKKKKQGFKGGGSPPFISKQKKTISKFINYYAQKLTCKHKVALTVAVERYLPTTALFNLLTMGVCLECLGGGAHAGCALEDRYTKRSNQHLAFFPLDTGNFQNTIAKRHHICPRIPPRATAECEHSNLVNEAAKSHKISLL